MAITYGNTSELSEADQAAIDSAAVGYQAYLDSLNPQEAAQLHQEHQAALEEGQGQDADTREDDVDASPAARAKARQLDVDLAELGEGSGEDGRILVADVEAAAQDENNS